MRATTSSTRLDNRAAYRLAGPWIAGMVLLSGLSLAFSLGLSFSRWDGIDAREMTYVGTEHYSTLFALDTAYSVGAEDPQVWHALGGQPADPTFVLALYNSLIYSAMAVPLGLIAALAMALLLNTSLRGIGFFRMAFYLPHVLGGVATALVWSWIFNPRFGPLNAVIATVYCALDPVVRLFDASGTSGWELPGWLMSSDWCKPAVAIMHAWTAGGAVFIFLAALQHIDPMTSEAAHLDGANRWRRFRHVTLPQLTPAILFNLVTGIAGAMQAFHQPYLLYNRSQNDGLLFYMLHLYRSAFEPPYRLGYASAMAWVLFVLLLILAGIAVISSRKWVHYAD